MVQLTERPKDALFFGLTPPDLGNFCGRDRLSVNMMSAMFAPVTVLDGKNIDAVQMFPMAPHILVSCHEHRIQPSTVNCSHGCESLVAVLLAGNQGHISCVTSPIRWPWLLILLMGHFFDLRYVITLVSNKLNNTVVVI